MNGRRARMKTHTAVAAVALVVLAVACGGEENAGVEQPSPLSVGDEAPSFSLPTAEGGMVSSSDFVGKPMLLYFSMGPG
jgi:cytochrome oxidase Cu insertion factor (SCO1/SenC/PrrC family)